MLALGAVLLLALAQTLDASPLRFEEASVKPTTACGAGATVDPGMIALNGVPLSAVLREAFGVRLDQIVGPTWLADDCFAIRARIPAGVPRERGPEMLQSLLADRFRLAYHRENRPGSGYTLTVDNNGPKFKETDMDSPEAKARQGQVTFRSTPGTSGIKGSMTMATLTRLLSNRLKAQVEDRTGLAAKYDIDLLWAPDRSFEPIGPFARATAEAHPDLVEPDLGVDLFTAIRQSLGLRLEARKEQIEIILIHRIERVPRES